MPRRHHPARAIPSSSSSARLRIHDVSALDVLQRALRNCLWSWVASTPSWALRGSLSRLSAGRPVIQAVRMSRSNTQMPAQLKWRPLHAPRFFGNPNEGKGPSLRRPSDRWQYPHIRLLQVGRKRANLRQPATGCAEVLFVTGSSQAFAAC